MITAKKLYPTMLAAVALVMGSCMSEVRVGGDHDAPGTKEVEIEISTSGQSTGTRAPLDGAATDKGDANEQLIDELDLLVFDGDGYLYRREASKLSGTNMYRVLLRESDEELDVYLLANCRTMLQTWEAADHTGQSWAAIRTQLVDTDPARLVGQSGFVPLPMFGSIEGQRISSTESPTNWSAHMLRSVASADLYVEQNAKIVGTFELKGLLGWYAADRGYLAAIESTTLLSPQQYEIPTGMTTTIEGALGTSMHAATVKDYDVVEGGVTTTYEGVAYQMYFYDNRAVGTAVETARPTRIIVAGRYKKEGVWQDGYYPLDLVDTDRTYRPLIRNWKYEFKVTAVTGPGYDTPEEAAEGAPIDLNVEIIQWNKDDVAVGVKGHYYVSMEDKDATLWRYADGFDLLGLTYEVLDGGPAEFEMDFEIDPADEPREEDAIENDYFKVQMTQTDNGDGTGGVSFEITALQDMTETDGYTREETVVVSFRELEFRIYITQYNSSEEDWGDGGDIPSDL